MRETLTINTSSSSSSQRLLRSNPSSSKNTIERGGFGALMMDVGDDAGERLLETPDDDEDDERNTTRKNKKSFNNAHSKKLLVLLFLSVFALLVLSFKAGYDTEKQDELALPLPKWAADLVSSAKKRVDGSGSFSDNKRYKKRDLKDTHGKSDPLQSFNWREGFENNNWDYDERVRNMARWKHAPANGGEKFTVCFKEGEKFNFFGAYNFINTGLKKPGMCVKNVKLNANVDDPSCDVRMFRNQHVPEVRPKTNPKQVDIFFTHESPSMYSPEMKDEKFRNSFDYVADYEKTSGLWFPFAVPVFEMKEDFPLFTIPRKERIPGVAWLARDCLSNRAETLRKISDAYPVFSVGNCANNVNANSFPESVMEAPRNRETSFQEPLSNFMFYFAVENVGVSCPEYVTEKIYYALSRGSIPIYIGWEGVNELLPGRDSWIDLRNYATPQQLAKRLREIAESDEEWEKMHKWRYENPNAWPKLFQKAIRQQTEDSKNALCALLQNGESGKRRKAGKEPKLCERQTKIFGQDLKIDGQEGFGAFKRDDIDEAHLGTNSLTDKDVGVGGKMHAWEKHLKKTCDTDNSCFKFIS